MASYNVALAESAHKELRHLPRHEIPRIHHGRFVTLKDYLAGKRSYRWQPPLHL